VKPFISKQGTKYKKIILVHIQVSCAIYKLAQGVNILTCSELFAIVCSIIGHVSYEVVMAINIMFQKLVTWPMNEKMQSIMTGKKSLCGMPNMQWVL
jgi:hypothetical protein